MTKHFHIVWARGSSAQFDFEPHKTEDTAETAAKGLVRPGEEWSIAEVDGECSEHCIAWLTRARFIKRDPT